jgi:uncharacterized protein (DUF58 family)
VGFAALNTGNNLLYLVLSFMLSFLVLSGFLSESALRGIQVERHIPDDLFARSDNPVSLRIHNRQHKGAAFAVVVQDHARVGDQTVAQGRCFVLRVGPGESEQRRYMLQSDLRGWLALTHFEVSTRFPFGLFTKSLRIPAPAEALVFPHADVCGARQRTARDERAGETRPGASELASVVSSVREFQRGDSFRRVHWRSSLRRDALIVGELEGERSAQIEVVLRTAADTPDFERRVEQAAGEVCAHLDAGLGVALRTDQRAWPANQGRRHRADLLGFLATVQAGEEDSPDVLDSERRASEQAS